MMLKSITVAFTCLAYLGVTLAQSTLQDLPDCALPCFNDALKSVNCANNDITCFCSNPVLSQNTVNCADDQCPVQDRSTTSGVLEDICRNAPTPSSSSASASASSSSSSGSSSSASRTSSQTTTGSTSSTRSTSPTTSASTTPVVTRITPPGSNTLTPNSQSQSGTVVVVQTVNLPDPSNLIGGAASLVSHMGGPIGTLLSVGLCALAGATLLVL